MFPANLHATTAHLSESDNMSELATLLPNVIPSPVHRIANSPAAKSLWQSLPTVSKKLRRILFRGLFLRVDLSKIDRTPIPRSHFITNKKDLH